VTFNGIVDCLKKTTASQGNLAIYNGFAVTIPGVMVYRGVQLGVFDTLMGLNPY